MTIILPEWLVLGGEPFATHAIVHRDLLPLRGLARRGENRILAEVAGRKPYFHLRDELDVTLRWFVNGFHDPDGVPFADPLDGLETNLEHYRTFLEDAALDPVTGCVDAELHLVGRTLTGEVQPLTWDPVRESGGATAQVLTRIIVPAGIWTVAP